ncbi:ImuA family protein [Sphingomonas sp. FW199]|uniref:ImuA family protein n=1 Tax=Sphingomonas sp. FW199 TaxID=3400217 RepID=UPI003CEB7374
MSESLRLVRRRIARIERRGPLVDARPADRSPTGHPAIDRALGGGLMRGRLHEVLATSADAGSGSGFAALCAQLIGGEMLWLVEEPAWRMAGALCPSGLAAIGMDPARLIVGVLPDAAAVLRAAVDGLRCPALGAVAIELAGDPRALDLTASRRLALAAESHGVTAILLRLDGAASPNAAQTRWRVSAAPSVPLAANAPGHPAWDIELMRQRGRPDGGNWRVEWNREQGRLCDWRNGDAAALPGAVVPVPADRPAAARPPLRQAG